jgi:glycosyltransferase involved in cell wall biosynthesis
VGRRVADLRILHVSHTAQPGGAELALARLLGADPPWSAGLCTPPGGTAFDDLPAGDVTVERSLPALPVGGTRTRSPVLAGQYLSALLSGARRLRRSPLFPPAGVVHANSAPAAIVAGLATRGRPVPLVVHLRDLVSVETLGRMGYRAFTRIGLRRADAVIANSRATLDSLGPLLPARVRRTVLQSPIGITERLTTAPPAGPVRVVGMVGRLQRWKGQHVVLEAFAHAFAGTGARLRFAGAPLFGEEAYLDELRALAHRYGLAERVQFLGHVADVQGFLDAADIVVHASVRPEPLGQTVIQALARARPVIATDGGGPREWIRPGSNGLLVPPGDPAALTEALRTLAGSAGLRTTLAAGAAGTPGILDDRACAAAHADFFHEVWRAG